MALTLSPALAAIIIKAHHGEKRGFFRWFENAFARLTTGYVGGVARADPGLADRAAAFAAVIAGIVLMFRILPGSFVPDEDQGYFFVIVEAPDTASQGVVGLLADQAQKIVSADPAVQDVAAGQRLQPGRRPVPQQRGRAVRVDEAVRGAQGRLAAELRRAAAAEPAVRRAQGGLRLRHQPAVDPGPGHHRRLRVLHPEPRRRRSARHRRSAAGLPGRGAAAARTAGRHHHLPRRDAAAVRRPRPQQGRGARRAGAGGVPDDAELLRLVDRRAVQPVQPRLVGGAAGRRRVPRRPGRLQQGLRPLAAPARWCRCRR